MANVCQYGLKGWQLQRQIYKIIINTPIFLFNLNLTSKLVACAAADCLKVHIFLGSADKWSINCLTRDDKNINNLVSVKTIFFYNKCIFIILIFDELIVNCYFVLLLFLFLFYDLQQICIFLKIAFTLQTTMEKNKIKNLISSYFQKKTKTKW